MKWLLPLVLATPAMADPLGLVDYDALDGGSTGPNLLHGGAFCTVVLPGGAVVQTRTPRVSGLLAART